MPVMSDEERAEGWQEYMIANKEKQDYTDAEGRAAFDALDQWFADHTVEMNQALPQPYRGAATIEDKAQLGVKVIHKRWIKGRNS